MTDARGLALSVLLPGFEGTTLPGWLAQRLAEGLGGVCLFGQNVAEDEQLRSLTDAVHAAGPGSLVASDEEGGSVTRVDGPTGSPWPGHAALGALDDADATYEVALGIGQRASGLGVDLVLAPVLDVNSEPDNPVIGARSFGASPDLVSRHGVAFVRGLQDAGVAACGKHFPGHGATRTDSHVGLPVLDVDEATWRERELPPFAAAVQAGVLGLMTAHVVVTSLDHRPATLSPAVLGLLREELGFDGLVVTDAVDMHAISQRVGRAGGAVAALAAGADLVCIGNPAYPDGYDAEGVLEELVAAVERALAEGALTEARLWEAAERVKAVGSRAVSCARSEAPRVPAHRGIEVARRTLTVRGDVGVRGAATVLATRTVSGYAAGRVPSSLLAELRERRPDWRYVEDATVADLPDQQGDVVLVVEGFRSDEAEQAVRAVLAARPDAVVVYGRLASAEDLGERRVQLHGAGAAAARATADLLVGGRR